MKQRVGLALGIWLLACGAAPPLSFVAMAPRFEAATAEYRRIWQDDGRLIVAAMEAATGGSFPLSEIEVLVRDGAPMISFDGRTIRLRASTHRAYMKATLVHEIGHRLAMTLPRSPELDDHRLLYLFLYDVWTDLYGRDFADRMVAIERRIRAPYDYDAAWSWALSMTREERRARLRALSPRLRYAIEEIAP
ncbi:MAG: hypothetical protein KF780_10085 [Sphingomonas sp.]|nr:hypothetical protein [Sphingomonas sp.]